MFSVFLISTLVLAGLLFFAVVALVCSVFKITFSLLWLPLKIVGALVGVVLCLAIGLPMLAVAVPIMLVLAVIGLPLLIIGGLFFGGLSLVGLA